MKNQWLQCVNGSLSIKCIEQESEPMDVQNSISLRPWSDNHADNYVVKPVGSVYLPPMFSDSVHNVAMIRHAMKLAINVTSFINPSQAPVLV